LKVFAEPNTTLMKLQELDHLPSPTTSAEHVEEDRLRYHLQKAINELPHDLPTHNNEQLLGQDSPYII
jgi:hypothetical protein